jgi:aminopeptidase N
MQAGHRGGKIPPPFGRRNTPHGGAVGRHGFLVAGFCLLLIAGCAAAPKPAVRAPTPAPRPYETPPCAVDFLHMKLEINLTQADIEAQRLPGRVTFRARPGPESPPIDTLQLNSVKLDVTGIRLVAPDGRGVPQPTRALKFRAEDPHLTIDLDESYRAGQEFSVQIDYVAHPQPEALYFTKPDDDHPNRPVMIYTMSEPLRARCWFPCHDWPDTRWPSDVYIRVPEPLGAVSIGQPVGEPVHNGDGTRTFHWRQTYPTDPHLVGLAISEFVMLDLGEWRGRPVRAYVQPGYEDAGRYTFRRVPDIIHYYAALIGFDYPYAQNTHVSVIDHFHGGMEHAGFSMVAPSMLTTGDRGDVPEDVPTYNYVAHMLAHMWFGGIVNYRDVREAWLNEAYATYLHHHWFITTEDDDAFIDEMWGSARRAAARDVAGRDKPVVRDDLGNDPNDVYRYDDGKVYFKGMWVLHMLRHQLGDRVFWGATRDFLKRNAADRRSHGAGSATTDDLRRAFETASGRDLRAFFDQWVYRDGLPRLEIAYAWDDAAKQAKVTIRQRQLIDAANPPFRFPIDIWFRVEGTWHKHAIDVTDELTERAIGLAREPDLFCVDPLGGLLAAKRESKPGELWRRQVRDGPSALSRSIAIEHLRGQRDPDALMALRASLLDANESERVRRRAAAALGTLRSDAALDALLQAARLETGQPGRPRPILRAALVAALARFPFSDEAYRAVLAFTGDDQVITVQAAAIRALGDFDRRFHDAATIQSLARAALPPMSRYVRSAASATLRRIDDPRALELLVSDTSAKSDDDLELRQRLLELVAALAAAERAQRPAAIDFLFAQLDDPRPSIRAAALRGLGSIGDDDTVARLRSLPEDKSNSVRSALNAALEAIERRVNAAPA